MLPISAPFPVGFGGGITPPPPPANNVPGQAASAFPGVPPVSQNVNQTPSAVPATGNADRPDTDAQGNNTETPTRGEYGESGGGESERDSSGQQNLSQEEVQAVKELSARDREVRAHEAAHMAVAGRYARGGIHFDLERGPDGRQYAVGGEVGIDTTPIANDPQATLRKAQTIRAAAMAPASPSSQDRRVAVEAARLAARAQMEILEQRQSEQDHPAGYKPPAIRSYDAMANYFQRMGSNSNQGINVEA